MPSKKKRDIYAEHIMDKEWRMNNLYSIVDKNGELTRFNMNPVQEDYIKNRVRRNIILKARQLGFTTLECIDGLDEALFNEYFVSVIIAHEKEAVTKIFKKVKIAWDNFPLKHLGWEVKTDTASELSFNNGSSIRVALSSRADTVNKLHITELGKICRKYPLKAEEIITGGLPSVPEKGRISIESTAEGEGGYFYDMFWEAHDNEAYGRKGDYKAFFYSWMLDPNYSIEERYSDIPQELLEYQEALGLTDGQIHWYYRQKKVLKGKMKQEYPSTPEEAFESSGEKIFDPDNIERRMKNDVKKPEYSGNWAYYEDYVPGHSYALGADVAEGIGRDSSTAVVIDFSYRTVHGHIRPKVVARYKSNKIAPDTFAHEVKNGGTRYGNCIAAVEKNNHGHATLSKLKEMYGNIYTERTTDKMADGFTERIGWHTTAATKPTIIFGLKETIENNELLVEDVGILRELKGYGDDEMKQIRYDEDVTKHYDLVMALAIAWEMRHFCGVGGKVRVHADPIEDPYGII